jgi:hypothetical protein
MPHPLDRLIVQIAVCHHQFRWEKQNKNIFEQKITYSIY